MNTPRLTRLVRALGLVSLVVAYGCTSDNEEGPGNEEQGEDELILRKGSVDHAAIVEVTTMMLAGGPLDGLLDPYNQEDPFAIRRAAFASTFADRLARFDAYDKKVDWSADQQSAWVSRVATGNYVVVDTDKPCGDFNAPHTYLEIERTHLLGRDHTTCGGRMPNEDAMDVTLNFLIRGPQASALDDEAVRDGVDEATHKSGAAFPYLANLNGF
jgi:hypothetical protein